MSEKLSFATPQGKTAKGFLAYPPGALRSPGLVVVHEWWGLNADIERLTSRFAAEGFLALAVDLYHQPATDDAAEAFARSNALSTKDAMDVIAGAVKALQGHARSSGKTGVTGFCLGGAMALAAACNVEGILAAAPFYGTPKDEFLDFTKARGAIQGHYAKNDGFVKLERATEIAERAKAAGVRFELHAYDAGHAFLREGDPAAYEPVSAKLAWERAITFLRHELAAD